MNQLFGLQHRRSENESIFEINLKDRNYFRNFQIFEPFFYFDVIISILIRIFAHINTFT